MRTLLLASCLAIALLGGSTAQSGDAGKIYDFTVDKSVTRPKVLRTSYAQFTEKARKERIQGVVLISGYVGADGRFHDAKVDRPLDPGLDANALESTRHFEFSPCTKDGQPVNCKMTVEVNFHFYGKQGK
jgi:TonB family protein